jgi:hypothetical protein
MRAPGHTIYAQLHLLQFTAYDTLNNGAEIGHIPICQLSGRVENGTTGIVDSGLFADDGRFFDTWLIVEADL